MDSISSPPPQTASPGPLPHDCGGDIAERPKKSVLLEIPVAAVKDEISDSCAESCLSSSPAPSSAVWDFKEWLVTTQRHRGALHTQDPEESSLRATATAQHHDRTKHLHAALSPVVEDNADADLRTQRRKLILTLQNAEAGGLTNWHSYFILYNERIEDPATLREILDEAVEKGISHLSPAEIETITAVQDDELPSQTEVHRCSFQDHSTLSWVPSSPALPKSAADQVHPGTPVSSKPSEAPAPDPDTPSDTDSHVSAWSPRRHPSGWRPINWGVPEEEEDDSGDGDDDFHDAAHRAYSPALTDDGGGSGGDDDDDDKDAAIALPEVGDCFRGRAYGGGPHPGVTWAALVEPLVLEDYVANMKAGKKVMALRRAREKEAVEAAAAATTTPKRKRTPRTPSPETRKNKRQKQKMEVEEEATQSQESEKAEETAAAGDRAGN